MPDRSRGEPRVCVQHVVGRLVEITVEGAITHREGAMFARRRSEALRACVEAAVVLCDFRGAALMSRFEASKAQLAMRSASHGFTHEAIVISSLAPVLALQLRRLVRDADDPRRAVFDRAEDALAWLDPVLTAIERARARAFLGMR